MSGRGCIMWDEEISLDADFVGFMGIEVSITVNVV